MYDQLMKVARGFRLVYVGMLQIILGVVAMILVMCLAGGAVAVAVGQGGGLGAVAGIAWVLIVLRVVILLLIVSGAITGLVGRFFCLAVPDRAGAAKPMIVVSVTLELLALGLGLVGSAAGLMGRRLPEMAVLGLQAGNIICTLTSAVLFLLFTRSVARFVRRSGLAEKAMSVLRLWVGTIACFGVAMVVGLVMNLAVGDQPRGNAGANGGAAMAVGCFILLVLLAALVLSIIALVKYVSLLREMSAAVARYAKRHAHEWEDEEEDDEYEDEYEDDDPPPRRARRAGEENRRPRLAQRDEDEDDDYDDRPRRRRRD